LLNRIHGEETIEYIDSPAAPANEVEKPESGDVR
jgi:hypothetical protein